MMRIAVMTLQCFLFVTVLLSSLAVAPLRGADAPPNAAALIDAIQDEVDTDQAMEYMRKVYATDRWFTFPKFHETVDYLATAMKEAGLTGVEVLGAPADGVSQFGYWTMPLAWDVKKARLEIVEPAPPEGFRVLADWQRLPHSLGMWSGPTAAGGVTAELVALPSTDPEELQEVDLKGKLVLVDRNPASFKWLLVEKGVLGAVSSFTENSDLEDGRQWLNAWGDAGWGYTNTSTPLLLFSISPRQEKVVKDLLAKGTVKLHAEVDTRYYEDTYPYVTAVVAGTGDEEVLALGHTAEAGAHDNATGVAVMLEGLATLHRLIEQGNLLRPRRTIRMLGMPEYYGTHHYIHTHRERMRRTVAAQCIDTPAGPYHLAGTEYSYYLNPHVTRSYADAFILKIADLYFPRKGVNRPWHWKPYMAGTDTFLADPTIGSIPTVWPYASSGIQTHHNSEDKPESVDLNSLRDLTVTTAAYLYYLAAAGAPEAHWLAEVALTRGLQQIVDAAAQSIDGLATADAVDSLGRQLYDGLEKIDYVAEREVQAVQSVQRLVPQQEGMRLRLDPLLDQLRALRETQRDRLNVAANRRAAELQDSRLVVPKPPPQDPKIVEASRIVVKRKRFGTLPLDDLPVPQREGYPNGAWSAEPITLLYWCDGRRDLAEVMRLTRLELGRPLKLDAVGYFRFLAKHGYVDLADQ